MVMLKILKSAVPAKEKSSSTAAMAQHATLAVRSRCSGVSLGVMVRNAGTVASGSTMTNNELPASRIYSLRPIGMSKRHAGPEVKLREAFHMRHSIVWPVDSFRPCHPFETQLSCSSLKPNNRHLDFFRVVAESATATKGRQNNETHNQTRM